MKADTKTETAVKAVMKEFAERYAKRDLAGVMALHASDPDVVVFAEGGKTIGADGLRALVENDFRQFDALSWTYGWTSISAAGPVAWVAADVTFKWSSGGRETAMVGPLTWVLENRGDKWLIVHGQVSLAPPELV